jgi:hypothetical protein
MVADFLRAALPALLFAALGSQPAHADIYTWVDTAGTINVSNLAPPEGARVTSIIHASASETAARDAAAREAARQADVQALNARVRQLEGEVELASRQAPPPDYRPIPAPPVLQYFVNNVALPPEQYAVDATPPAYAGCNPGWIGCGAWWAYPVSILVLRTPNSRPTHPGRGQHDFAVQQPFAAPQPMHPPFVAPLPTHPPFASDQPLPPPFGPRKG